MDIGAPCKQCLGRGRIGGGPLYAYAGQAARPTACDLCHGSGRNDFHSPTVPVDPLDMPVPGIPGLRVRDLELQHADLKARDDLIAERVACHGRYHQGQDDFLPSTSPRAG